ncbi:MAG: serine/threonine-protein kinase PknK, partial [Verrucomicrobia bacterium]|nr:serine/threonine-protein kinase PknK [Verrucomicrobiota bacterium]
MDAESFTPRVLPRGRVSFPVIELSRYAFESLRTDEEFNLYRSRRNVGLSSFAKATEDKSAEAREDVGSASLVPGPPDEEGPSSVLVLTPVLQQAKPGTIKRLEHEYSLRDQLDPDWAVRPLTLIRRHGRPVLVCEDPGGESLSHFVGQPMEIPRFLRLAIRLTAGLSKLHSRGLIHKDIKPANILVDPAIGAVWLTGFGIASRLPRERQMIEPAEVIAGTLAYMAPEQTGRMNRSIDSRSDLYSVGVTFYEMLTGVLPFQASDPLELIHCHIARRPAPPCERLPEIPTILSAIVMKLLEKTGEERYQTAAGLEADLKRCLAEWEPNQRIAPFQLGSDDIPDQLRIPEKLYGRDVECQILLNAFDRVVSSGIPELVLVSGYSGIGKSSVVNELHKAIVLPRGIFISGKFDQQKQDVPYATLAQAFAGLVRQILAQSEEEVSCWRNAIAEAAGPNGQLLVNLIPELELVIGPQLPLPEIAPHEAQNRFDTVLRRFIAAFAQKEHPLALFLDDLQWLDTASLKLLQQLVTHEDVSYLLLIGAYRSNEITPSHPLRLTLNQLRETEAIIHEILLLPLTIDDVTHLVADSLRCKPEQVRAMAELVHEKSGGNPFFAIQFLTALADEHLLQFDSSLGHWTWDLERSFSKNYTDNVVDLMVEKLNRLPKRTQEILKMLACLGNQAESTTLQLVHSGSEPLHADLWDAIRAGFVLSSGGFYKFLHDRVQEAAYSLITEDQRPGVHLRIGQLLLAHTRSDQLEEKIFEIVNQLNRGAALIGSPEQKLRLADLNLIAGRRAKASAAYDSALNYFSFGAEIAGSDIWENRRELAYQLGYERAESEFLNRNFTEALSQFHALLAHAGTKLEKANIYRVMVDIYTTTVEIDKAIICGLEALRLFGINIPAHPDREDVAAEYDTIWKNLDDRSIGDLINLPLMTEAEMKAAMALLVILFAPCIATDRNLLLLCCCRMVNMSIRHGNSDGSVMAYGYLGMNLGPFFGNYRQGFEFGRLGHDLAEQRGFVAYRAKVNFIIGAFISFWHQPLETSIEHLRTAFKTAVAEGDLNFASYSCDHLVSQTLVAGEPLDEVYRKSEPLLDFTRRSQFDPSSQIIIRTQRFVDAMRGRTNTINSLSSADFDQAAYEQFMDQYGWPSVTCIYYIMKLQLHVMCGDYEGAISARGKAKRLLWTSLGMIHEAEYWFYSALSLAGYCEKAAPELRQECFEELIVCQKKIDEWA